MSDEEIRRLLTLRSKGPNLDYKAGFPWTKENRDKKYELIRDLIALANIKDGGDLLKSFNDILTGRPAQLAQSAADSYEPEIAAAETFLQSKLGPRLAPGHFEVVAYPTIYNAKRIGTIPEVADAVEQSEVNLRGWNFPHTDKKGAGRPFAAGFRPPRFGSATSRAIGCISPGCSCGSAPTGRMPRARKAKTGGRCCPSSRQSGRSPST